MPIVPAREKTNEAVKLISKFQSGEIKPISFGNDALGQWLNDIMVGGLLPGTICTIGGLSGHGKTHFLQRIENNILSQDPNVILVRANWESTVYKLLLRKIKQKTRLKIKDVLFNKQVGKNLDDITDICNEERREGIFFYEDVVSPAQFYEEMSAFLKENIDKKVVITIDHVGLIKGREKQAIDELFEVLNKLKKEHPYVVFLPLMQLERDKLINRRGDSLKEAPIRSDYYGSDQLFQVSDGVITIYNAYKVSPLQKYMKFPKGRYENYLEKFIVSGGDVWEHFDCRGRMFYHATKTRDVDDLSDYKDVFVEQLFEVKDTFVTSTGSNADAVLDL
jgi:archaellum biogenesis ATPase FlaH